MRSNRRTILLLYIHVLIFSGRQGRGNRHSGSATRTLGFLSACRVRRLDGQAAAGAFELDRHRTPFVVLANDYVNQAVRNSNDFPDLPSLDESDARLV